MHCFRRFAMTPLRERMLHDMQIRNLRFHGQLEPLHDPRAFAARLALAAQAEWVVYAKPPFGGAAQVLDYLGRSTHRVAISNNRLMRFDGNSVLFRKRLSWAVRPFACA
ncbi:transposase [Paraburkholderia sp. CNPSo 3274]|uniref:transposase n=1 Tax=Paraburkholderia sp. CNPSo 3274 TaxID=2940932 RepID=UPI0035CD3603